MARTEYGGTLADFTTTSAGLIRGGLDLYAWTLRTGGTRISDLVALAGGTITTDSGGSHLVTGPGAGINLLGPDGYAEDGIWVSADPSPSAPRYRLRALALVTPNGEVVDNTLEYTQATPAASWLITHTLGRRPAVTLYVAGVEVDADVAATTTQVSVTFPAPTTGSVVLA